MPGGVGLGPVGAAGQEGQRGKSACILCPHCCPRHGGWDSSKVRLGVTTMGLRFKTESHGGRHAGCKQPSMHGRVPSHSIHVTHPPPHHLAVLAQLIRRHDRTQGRQPPVVADARSAVLL
eukprot:COSAG03_NODE_111_length_12507_cov_28.124355_12_plen_120_part_00